MYIWDMLNVEYFEGAPSAFADYYVYEREKLKISTLILRHIIENSECT